MPDHGALNAGLATPTPACPVLCEWLVLQRLHLCQSVDRMHICQLNWTGAALQQCVAVSHACLSLQLGSPAVEATAASAMRAASSSVYAWWGCGIGADCCLFTAFDRHSAFLSNPQAQVLLPMRRLLVIAFSWSGTADGLSFWGPQCAELSGLCWAHRPQGQCTPRLACE